MRIMLVSVVPWAGTGYGTITARLARSLKSDGHEVAIAATFGLMGGKIEWEGITVFPQGQAALASDVIRAHIDYWKPDFVITFGDLWHVDGYGGREFKWVAWIPIDHDPLSYIYREKLKPAWKVLAMSQHGKKQLEEAGIKSTLIPLGISDQYFQDDAARKAWRDAYGISKDTFVFGIVGMNAYWPSRKGFDRLLEAFKEVHDNHPDTLLFLHTTQQASYTENFNLDLVADVIGLDKNAIKYTDLYPLFLGYDELNMRAMYNGFDCFVLPTQGEGFGLPVVEAQACGVPVIATDCTSMPEITQEDMRILVPAKKYLGVGYGSQYDVYVDKLVEAMDAAYTKLKDKCDCHAGTCDGYPWRRIVSTFAKGYEWSHIYSEHWRPYLAGIQRELESPVLSTLPEDLDVEVVEQIRKGQTASYVYRVKYQGNDAIMKIDSGQELMATGAGAVAELLVNVDHPSIPKILRVFKTRFDHDGIVQEYAGKPVQMGVSLEQRWKIYDQMAAAIDHLHQHGIAHRDIKLDNVVVDKNGKASLVDFGWAVRDDSGYWIAQDNYITRIGPNAEPTGLATLLQELVPEDDLRKKEALSRATGSVVQYEKGERDPSTRYDLIRPRGGFKGMKILDVGCNDGWFVDKALEDGAVAATGVDVDANIIEVARSRSKGLFYQFDVDNDVLAVLPKSDVVFSLSVIMHLRRPERLYELWDEVGAKEVYFEPPAVGQYNSTMSTEDWQVFLRKKGWTARLLGISDRQRSVLHLRREHGN